MYVHIYVCVYTYICMYVCMYVYTQKIGYLGIRTYVCVLNGFVLCVSTEGLNMASGEPTHTFLVTSCNAIG